MRVLQALLPLILSAGSSPATGSFHAGQYSAEHLRGTQGSLTVHFSSPVLCPVNWFPSCSSILSTQEFTELPLECCSTLKTLRSPGGRLGRLWGSLHLLPVSQGLLSFVSHCPVSGKKWFHIFC